jgi:hypothetical protein
VSIQSVSGGTDYTSGTDHTARNKKKVYIKIGPEIFFWQVIQSQRFHLKLSTVPSLKWIHIHIFKALSKVASPTSFMWNELRNQIKSVPYL